MNVALKCPTCEGPVKSDHAAFRGILINATLLLQSRLISTKEQLTSLEKKRWSKQFAEQRDRDVALRDTLKRQIESDEELLRQLKSINGACYE